MIDLDTISREIKEDIDSAIVEKAKASQRESRRLPASMIGHECKAHLWFMFRWAKLGNNFDARLLRLFDRGHLEEVRINEWLRMSGWIVQEYDPVESLKNGKPTQWGFSAINGHFGGYSDGKGTHPKYPQLGEVLLEDKTHGTKPFGEVLRKGVVLSMPKHSAQMNVYGKAFELNYGLYFPVNKNDDDIKPEVIKLDRNEADFLFEKAESIINSQYRPERVSPDETYFTCKYCQFAAICHRGDSMAVSCRSCANATPVADGQWYCGKWQGVLPEDFILKACGDWVELEH